MIRAALLAALLLAQEETVIRSSVINVQVPVTVADEKGNPIHGLTAEDFRLLDGGVAQTIQVDEAAHPVSLVVAVQSNTNARDVLTTIRKASALLGPLVAGDTGEVCVLSFDHRVQVLTSFTSSGVEIQEAFAKIQAGGGLHHLNDAAMEGVRLLNGRSKGRKKMLLLIGEGFDKGSEVTPEDVFTQAELNGILIYALKMPVVTPDRSMSSGNRIPPEQRGPGPMGTIQTGTTDAQTGGYSPPLNQVFDYFRGLRADSHLAAYAKFTGGREQGFSNQRNLEQAIERIGKEVHSQYLLTFAPQVREFGYRPIAVEVRVPNLQVRARSGYWAAP